MRRAGLSDRSSVGRLRDLLRDRRMLPQLGLIKSLSIEEDGIFCEVELPAERNGAGDVVTIGCRLALTYCGASWGLVTEPEVGDEVVVAVPRGDIAEGGVIIGRMPTEEDTLPSGVGSGRVLLVVKPGAELLIQTSGGGKVRIEADGDAELTSGGTVYLGQKSGAEELATKSWVDETYAVHIHTESGAKTGPPEHPVPPAPLPSTHPTTTKVKAK